MAYFPKRASRCFLLICLEAKANAHSAFCSEVVPTNRSNRNHCLQRLEPFYSVWSTEPLGGSSGTQTVSRVSQSEPTPYGDPRCSAYHGRTAILGLRVTSGVLQGHKSTRGPNAFLRKLMTGNIYHVSANSCSSFYAHITLKSPDTLHLSPFTSRPVLHSFPIIEHARETEFFKDKSVS